VFISIFEDYFVVEIDAEYLFNAKHHEIAHLRFLCEIVGEIDPYFLTSKVSAKEKKTEEGWRPAYVMVSKLSAMV
jgi:hypothetical protein